MAIGNPKLKTCSGCEGPRDRGKQRYCRACHAEAQRKFRARHKAEIAELKRAVANDGVMFHEKHRVDAAA